MKISLDKTEIKIIESTLKALVENNNPTTIKIAKTAGVSEVTIFRKFKSKKNLLEVTKDYYLNFVLTEIDQVFKYEENKKFDDLLKEIWWNILNFFETNINIFKVAIKDAFSAKIIEIVSKKILEKLTNLFQNAIANKKIRKINPQIAALNIYSMIFQPILLWRVYGAEPIDNLEEKLDGFLDILFNGIKY